MIILGIDPGLTGAVAKLGCRGEYLDVRDIPTMARGNGKGFVKRQVNAVELAVLVRDMVAGLEKNEVQVILEAVNSMGGQGVASMFSFGLSSGIIEGVIAALRLPHDLVTPAVWKGAMKLSSVKEQVRARAIRMYPTAPLGRMKDHNRAEAIMLARYGWEKFA